MDLESHMDPTRIDSVFDLDPQIHFRVKENQFLDELSYEPQNVDVLDIVHSANGHVNIDSKSLSPEQWEKWLDTPLTADPKFFLNGIRGALRLILGASAISPIGPESASLEFPADERKIVPPRRLPFSRSHFKLVIDRFGLPAATPWLCHTRSGHFQRYHLQIDPDTEANTRDSVEESGPESAVSENEASTGITMRRTSKGILAIDLALSLSHNHKTGITHALLLGRSELQAAYIKQQILDMAGIAHHPAFLPTLVCANHRSLLQRLSDQINGQLFGVEAASGQTMVGYDGVEPMEERNWSDITNGVLGVIQLATAWEMHAKAVLYDVECIQEFVTHVNLVTPVHRGLTVKAEGEILDERLRFLGNKGQLIVWRMQFVTQRAQAQQNAVYNYIALQNNLVNRDLAYDSRELAVAAKSDSNAMKSISIITMVFLPGTFVATLFATPAFVETSPRQWVYWLVTVVLTLSVIGLWTFWFRWVTRKADALPITQLGTFGTLQFDSKRTQHSRSQQADPPASLERAGTPVAKKPRRALRKQAPAAWSVELPQ